MDDLDYKSLTSAQSCGEEPLVRQNKIANTYDGRGFYVTLRLSDMQGAEIIERDADNAVGYERGIFIPFKANDLLVTSKKNVIAVFRAEVSQVPSPKYTHLLSQVVSGDVVEARRRLGFKFGFVGHMRPFGHNKNKKSR